MEEDDLSEDYCTDDFECSEGAKLLNNDVSDRVFSTSHRYSSHAITDSDINSTDFHQDVSLQEECDTLTVDQVLERIGSFGWYQAFIVIISAFPALYGGFQFLETVFTMADSPWECINGSLDCLLNGTIFPGDTDHYNHRCKVPRDQWRHVAGDSSTAVVEWDLVCQRAILATIAKSCILVGCFFGNMTFGVVADRYGRKTPTLITLIVCNSIAAVGSFSPWFSLFALTKLLAGVGVGASITLFVLAMEVCGVEYRATAGVIHGTLFPLGLCILTLVSYIFTQWRHICLALNLISYAIFLPLFWIPESMRWNILNGRVSKAEKTLRRIAKSNGKEMPLVSLSIPPPKAIHSQSGNVLDLLRTWQMARQTLVIWFGFLACGLVYYGVAMSTSTLGANKYFSFLISSAIEIPAHLVCIWLLNRIGRKYSLVMGLIGAAIFATTCVIAFPLHQHDSQGMKAGRIITAVVAKVFIVISFVTVYIFAAEIFPTTLRTTGVNTGSGSARVGAISAPYVLYLRKIHLALPYSILGIIGLIAGLLCLTLRETKMTPTKDVLGDVSVKAKEKDIELKVKGRTNTSHEDNVLEL